MITVTTQPGMLPHIPVARAMAPSGMRHVAGQAEKRGGGRIFAGRTPALCGGEGAGLPDIVNFWKQMGKMWVAFGGPIAVFRVTG